MPGIAGGYAGISIQSTDGATTKNIRCENITMENITTPFVIWLSYREKGSRLSDIVIKNIFADNCDIASSITGFKKHGEIHYAENITIENINVTYRQAKEKTASIRVMTPMTVILIWAVILKAQEFLTCIY